LGIVSQNQPTTHPHIAPCGRDGWMDGWMIGELETLFSLDSSSTVVNLAYVFTT